MPELSLSCIAAICIASFLFLSFIRGGVDWSEEGDPGQHQQQGEAIEPLNRRPTDRPRRGGPLSVSLLLLQVCSLPLSGLGVCNRTEIEEAPSLSQQSPEFVRQAARPAISLGNRRRLAYVMDLLNSPLLSARWCGSWRNQGGGWVIAW